MSSFWGLFLIIFIPVGLLFFGGAVAAFTVGGWLGTPLIMLGMAALCLSGYWVRPLMRWWGRRA